MQIWELYSIILVDKLIKGCVKVNFEFKDKYDINDLISLITLLRAPGGCPWDREQTHESIKSNFIEETYEVIEAINKNSISGLREELGDVLLQMGALAPHHARHHIACQDAGGGQGGQVEKELAHHADGPACNECPEIVHVFPPFCSSGAASSTR